MSALLLFACMDTTTKYLVAIYNVPLVVAIRYITHCALMLVFVAPSQGKKLIQTKRTGLVIIRASSLAMASLFVALALQRMPVAETTAIIFLGPMLVVLLAGPILNERISSLGWVVATIGLVGVLLMAHPGSSLDLMGTVFALLAMGALVIYQLLSRVLVSTEQTLPMLFYTALIGCLVYGIFLPWFWYGPMPGAWELLLFFSMGLSGGIGHFLYTAAYRHAPASLLAPMNNLQLLWAGLLGFAVFSHTPDMLSMVGMSIIAASGVMIAFISRPIESK